jgi:hypothetical protein
MLWLLPVISVGHAPLAVGSIEGVLPELPPELELLELPPDPELLDPPELPLELELVLPPELLLELAPLLELDPPGPPELELDEVPPPLPELLPLDAFPPLPLEPPEAPPLELPPPKPGEGDEPLQAGGPRHSVTKASDAMHTGSRDFMGFPLPSIGPMRSIGPSIERSSR